MIVIGIDSGATGCICELNVYEKTARYLKIPYRENGIINGFEIERAFEGFASVHKLIIESVHGRGYSNKTGSPKWGATQVFGMGKNFGQIIGLLHHVPMTFVEPQMWQKRAHRGATGVTAKERSAIAFASLNPSFGKIRKCDNGLIDAFFIARWALDEARIIYQDDWNFSNIAGGE